MQYLLSLCKGSVMDDKLLLSRKAAAAMLSVSIRHLINMETDGRIPPSRRLGLRRLFSRAELQRWIDNGCPPVGVAGPGDTFRRLRAGR